MATTKVPNGQSMATSRSDHKVSQRVCTMAGGTIWACAERVFDLSSPADYMQDLSLTAGICSWCPFILLVFDSRASVMFVLRCVGAATPVPASLSA